MTLIRQYPLQEGSGTTAHDVRSSSHGTISGATLGATGPLGKSAYSFDGTDDYTDAGSIGGIENVGQFSVSLWMDYDSGMEDGSNYGVFWISDGDFTQRAGIRFGLNGNTVGFTPDGNNDAPVGPTYSEISAGNWYHVVGVYDGSNYYCYFDGKQEGSGTATNSTTASFSNTAKIGRTDDWSAYFDGRLADVRVYDHALTPSEVQYLYEVSLRSQFLSGWQTI